MTIAAILFDLGRVIVHFDMSGCEATLASRAAVGPDDLMRILWDSGSARSYERGEISREEFYGFVKSEAGLRMTLDEFMKCWTEVFDPVPILPAQYLATLARRYPMTLVSNTSEAHAAYVRDNYDVFRHFRNLVFSYEVGSLKPDRRIFERAIDVAGFSPGELLFIDDREENILAARELGIRAHHFAGVDGLTALFQSMGVDLGAGDGGA
jgi:putative hydrolase of the HAD superfamily